MFSSKCAIFLEQGYYLNRATTIALIKASGITFGYMPHVKLVLNIGVYCTHILPDAGVPVCCEGLY